MFQLSIAAQQITSNLNSIKQYPSYYAYNSVGQIFRLGTERIARLCSEMLGVSVGGAGMAPLDINAVI